MVYAEAPVHPLSIEDVNRMRESGVLGPEDRVELIDGVLVDVVGPTPPHSAVVEWLNRHFVTGLPGHAVRVQDILREEEGWFVPDLLVVDPVPRDRHPFTARLVVEVAVSTQRHDAWKAHRYARASAEEYWIVDVPARVLRVHRDPGETGYARVSDFRDGDSVQALLGAPPVDVTELLGPAT